MNFKDKSRLFCPRCMNEDVIEYEEVFDCTHCRDWNGIPLEFDKKMFNLIDDKSAILSNNELRNIIKVLNALK